MASLTSDFMTMLKSVSAITDAFTLIEHRFESDLTSFDFESCQLPALIIFPGEETTEPNEHNGFVAQKTTPHIHCLIVVEHTFLDDMKNIIRASALGWQQTSNHDLTELLSAMPMKQVGQAIYWLDTYITRIQIRQS